MYNIPLEFLVSPVTKKKLILKDASTLIDEEGNEFHKDKRYGFWNFIPERSPIYNDDQWAIFKRLINNFLVSYRNHPEANVSYDERQDVLEFGDFCNFRGMVLDIGCGPHKVPSYIKYKRSTNAQYYGLDILEGEHPKELDFIKAMGEHIPFRDDLFDITVSGTSLLHYVNMKQGIRDALRVTKPTGYFCVWIGTKSEDAPKPKERHEWYENLKTPAGAETPFHYRRPVEEDFEAIIHSAGGHIINKKKMRVDAWRENLFYRVSKRKHNP